MLALVLLLGAQAPAPPQPRTVAECGTPLRSLALDRRGERVFSLGAEGALAAWELATGAAAWTQTEEGLQTLVCSEKTLFAALGIPAVTSFDPETGERLSALGCPPPFTATAGFVADSKGRWAWFGQERGLIRVTPSDVNSWSRRKLENGGVTTLALDAGDDLLAIGGEDGSVRFANCKSASVDDGRVLAGHTGPITALAFLPKSVASASEDGSVRVWTLASGKAKHTLQTGAPVVRVLASEPGGLLAAADGAGTLVVWEAAKKGAERMRWTSPAGTPLVALAFTAKGELLLAAHGSQIVAFELAGAK